MKIEIKSRGDDFIILSGNYESVKDCLEKNRGAYLEGADLRGADLRGAYLEGAYLRGAKNYRDLHDIFVEAVRRQPVSVFIDAEWGAIAQITIHRLCWDSIKKRFSAVMPHIFEILAEKGFAEWLEYWREITAR